MHLVVNHVTQFDHIDDTDCSILVEPVSCTTVSKMSSSEPRKACLICIITDRVNAGTVENRCTELDAQFGTCPSENGLVNLTEVHTRRHTKRVKNYIYWSTILEERHILLSYDLGNDTLVTMSTGHLVTDSDLSLLGDVNFCKLHDTI